MEIGNVTYTGAISFKPVRGERTKLLAFTGNDNALMVLNARSAEVYRNTTHTNTVTTAVEYINDRHVSGSKDSTVKMYEQEGAQVWSYSAIIGEVTSVDVERVNGDEGHVFAASTSELAKIDYATGTQLWRLSPHTGVINQVHASIHGEVYTVSDDGTLKQIHATDGTTTWTMSGHTGFATCVVTDYDGNVFSGDSNGRLIKTNVAGVVQESQVVHTGAIVACRFDIVGNIHTLGADGVVKSFNQAMTELSSITVQGTVMQDMDVDHMGRFFIKSDDHLRCYDQTGVKLWVRDRVNGSFVSVTKLPIMIAPVILSVEYVAA